MGVLFKADQPAVRGYDRAMPGQANMRDTVAGMETVDRNLKIAVAIATSGRRDVLTQTILFLNRQTLKPDELLVCPAKPADVDLEGIAAYDGEVRVISGPVGLPHQRNALMAASDADIMLFLDDDFLPAPNYLEELKQLLCFPVGDMRFELHAIRVAPDGQIVGAGGTWIPHTGKFALARYRNTRRLPR